MRAVTTPALCAALVIAQSEAGTANGAGDGCSGATDREMFCTCATSSECVGEMACFEGKYCTFPPLPPQPLKTTAPENSTGSWEDVAAELFGTLTGAGPGKNSREIVAALLNITGSSNTAPNLMAINSTATNSAVNTTTVELCA